MSQDMTLQNGYQFLILLEKFEFYTFKIFALVKFTCRSKLAYIRINIYFDDVSIEWKRWNE